ncbi:MAG TPA: hypothetical protein VEH06_04615 [Candidatus Bathyarchaeia archaeon]|nr:hypothetical protein [Candidatus Bathyarchaeia archaeon]
MLSANIHIEKNVDSGTNTVYVAHRGRNTVSIINTFIKTNDISVGISPMGVAVNPITNMLYLTNCQYTITNMYTGISLQ